MIWNIKWNWNKKQEWELFKVFLFLIFFFYPSPSCEAGLEISCSPPRGEPRVAVGVGGTRGGSQNQGRHSLCVQVLLRSLLIILKHWELSHRIPTRCHPLPLTPGYGLLVKCSDVPAGSADEVHTCEPGLRCLPRPLQHCPPPGSLCSSGWPFVWSACPALSPECGVGVPPASPSYFPDLGCLPSSFVCSSLMRPVIYWTGHMVQRLRSLNSSNPTHFSSCFFRKLSDCEGLS